MLSIEIIYREGVPDIKKPLFCVQEYWFTRGLPACANIIREIKLTEILGEAPSVQLHQYIGFKNPKHENFTALMNSLKFLKSQGCQLNVQLFENSKYTSFFLELTHSYEKFWPAVIAIFVGTIIYAGLTANLTLMGLASLGLVFSGEGFFCMHEPSVRMSFK